MSYLKLPLHQSATKRFNFQLTLLILLGCLIQVNVFAQNTWVNYANDHLIYAQATEGDTTLWVGSQNGLIKIDLLTNEKETFQAWNSPLKGQGVRGIAIGDGVRWFGADNGGFFREENGEWQHFLNINTGNDLIRVENIKLDADGNPWFFSTISEHLVGKPVFMSYNDQFSYFVNHDYILETEIYGCVREFVFTDDGDMWVLQEERLVRYNGELVIEAFDFNEITTDEEEGIYNISIDHDGNVWATASKRISTGPGASGFSLTRALKYDGFVWTVEFSDLRENVAYVKGKDGSFWVNSFDNSQYTFTYRSLKNGVWTIFEQDDLSMVPNGRYNTPQLRMVDSNGDWWIYSYSGVLEPKIHKLENNELSSYSTEIFPLGANRYDTVLEDCDGNIWALDQNFFSKFDGEKWTNFDAAANGMDGSPSDAFLHPETCEIWMTVNYNNTNSTSTGSLAVFDGEELEVLSFKENLPSSTTNIDLAPDGTIYIASGGEGLISFVDGVFSKIDLSYIPVNLDYLYDVTVQLDSTIWISSFSEVVRIKGNDWEVFDFSNSPISYIENFYLDNSDNLWISIANGIARWEGTGWETFVFDEEPKDVSSILEDQNGNFWIGTFNGGAYYWNGASFIKYDILNSGISSNYIKEIFVDQNKGDVWFLHTSGMSVLQGFSFQASISGATFYDEEQDGIYDPGIDVRLPNQRVMLLPDSTIAITNTIGSYAFYPEEIGLYSVESLPESSYTSTSPSVIYDTVFTRESIKNLDFGLWFDDIPEGISIDITTSPVICHGLTNFWITLENEGFNDIDGDLTLNFDPEFKEYSTFPEPSSIAEGQASWEFSNLGFREIRQYYLQLVTPGVDFLDQEFIFEAEVNTANESYMETVEAEILCSYDPNDKMANSVGESRDNFSLLEDPIQYTIRFQNLGNYKATDVFITDEIDESLDISSLRIISSSHDFTSTLRNREITFRFDDIDLPPEEQDEPGSHGFIKYEIAPIADLPDPTIIENTALIYFDQNPAIITNTTENILVESLDIVSSTNSLMQEDRALVFPNPSGSDVWIEWAEIEQSWSVKIYDLSGRLYRQVDSEVETLMVSNLESGFYMFEFTKGDMTQFEKVIITK